MITYKKLWNYHVLTGWRIDENNKYSFLRFSGDSLPQSIYNVTVVQQNVEASELEDLDEVCGDDSRAHYLKKKRRYFYDDYEDEKSDDDTEDDEKYNSSD
ncbi:hypothetical protein FQA39_LY09504 [Lamprigera yunnana]|nr:hypothetical protein FQA39_LY09504 [Lamprigera yunnana]